MLFAKHKELTTNVYPVDPNGAAFSINNRMSMLKLYLCVCVCDCVWSVDLALELFSYFLSVYTYTDDTCIFQAKFKLLAPTGLSKHSTNILSVFILLSLTYSTCCRVFVE